MSCCDFGRGLLPYALLYIAPLFIPGVIAAVWCVRHGQIARALIALILTVPIGLRAAEPAVALGITGWQLYLWMIGASLLTAALVVLAPPPRELASRLVRRLLRASTTLQ